ncbi:MAG: flagellar hook assembly protein FlgD [Desulfovibrio sp.]|jgi:flagellar basal-body rod modification protein FlgD|nr:flagellar hook assembly protein FlgD [Desulfovibrio sp.]
MSATQAVLQANNEFNAALSQTKGSVLDKDSFLLLLVTQFKYQDPLDPMDDKEFIAQMAQFSSLEQLMNLNTGMEGLTEATNNQQMINATSYIGKQVTVSGSSIGKVTDAATGAATITRFRYAPQDTVASGSIAVYDQSNNIVYTESVGSKSAGTTYEFIWNGTNNAGQTVADGVYTVGLSLLNAKGEAVLSDQVVDATVTGVVNDGGVVYLGLEGGQLMPLANVRQVVLPNTVAADGSSDSAGDALNALLNQLQNAQNSQNDQGGESQQADEAAGGSADSAGDAQNAQNSQNDQGGENQQADEAA